MSDIPPVVDTSTLPPVILLNVSFDDNYEALQVTYVESRNLGPKGYKQDTLTISADVLNKEELQEVVDAIVGFVDSGLLHLRTGE